MFKKYLKKTDLVLVQRWQEGELNPLAIPDYSEMPLSNVDWSTDSSTTVVSVGYNPDPAAYEPSHHVFRDVPGREYIEINE